MPPPVAVVEQLVLNSHNEPVKYYVSPGYVPPPPVRRRRGRILGVCALVLVVLAGLVTAGVVYSNSARRDTAKAGPSPQPGSPTPSAAPTTAAPDLTTLDGVLTEQAAALIGGDEAGWLAAVDPTATAATAEYSRIFHNLRAMKVASWRQSSPSGRPPGSSPQPYAIDVSYCLVQTPCNDLQATLTVSAELKGDRVLLESITTPKPDENAEQPLPWMASNLSAVVGKRVVVAASTDEQGRLSSALRSAEQAAEIADQYAHWTKPDIYVVYLAGAGEAKTWFGGEHDPDIIVSTWPVGDYDIEMVMHMPGAANDAGPGGLTETMRWAMGEVAVEYGAGGDGNNSLVNGMAVYVATVGHASWMNGYVQDVRTYLRSGKWSKNIYLLAEFSSTNSRTRSAAEGIGALAIRHLVQRFGLTKTLEFWGDVERGGYTLDDASSLAFGLPWKSINTDCVNYIEHTV